MGTEGSNPSVSASEKPAFQAGFLFGLDRDFVANRIGLSESISPLRND
jgi:hypothetical protein